MAENRTFQFMGQGYGNTPVSIVASINNTVIYSGEVPTIERSANQQDSVLFTIDNSADLNTDFAGSLPMTVVVSGGQSIKFGLINSNYYNEFNEYYDATYQVDSIVHINDTYYQCIQECTGISPPDSDYWRLLPDYVTTGGTPDNFNLCYFGEPTNSEKTGDPRSSVAINGIQQVPPLEKSPGCWIWVINTGDVITYNWNIARGQVGNVEGDTSNYSGKYIEQISNDYST
jgi:hypothetical protein